MTTPSGPERSDPGLAAIVSERRQLINLAYRLLGSLAEAEDAVQEGYARWYALTPGERDVAALLPRPEWTAASNRLTWHGRRVCHARRPACGACGIAHWCPSFGIGPTDEAAARKLVKAGPFS